MSVRWKVALAFTVLLTLVAASGFVWMNRAVEELRQEKFDLTSSDITYIASSAARRMRERIEQFGSASGTYEMRLFLTPDADRPVAVAVSQNGTADEYPATFVAVADPSPAMVAALASRPIEPGESTVTQLEGGGLLMTGPPSVMPAVEVDPLEQDAYGAFITQGYTPIRIEEGARAGEMVGLLGVTYTDYFENSVATLNRRLAMGFGLGYLVLLPIVLLLAGSLTGRLRHVTRIADGMGNGHESLRDAPADLTKAADVRLPDELARLATVLADMAKRVATREQALRVEVQRLTVEVDEVRKRAQVAEITESAEFDALAARAAAWRAERTGRPNPAT